VGVVVLLPSPKSTRKERIWPSESLELAPLSVTFNPLAEVVRPAFGD
jgi:hypothetical protein